MFLLGQKTNHLNHLGSSSAKCLFPLGTLASSFFSSSSGQGASGSSSCPYEILGLPRGASREEVKAAYLYLVKRLHPDVNPGDQGAADRFRAVKEAYDLLSSETRKEKYDLSTDRDRGRQHPLSRHWHQVRKPTRSDAEHEAHHQWREELIRQRNRRLYEDMRQQQWQQQQEDPFITLWKKVFGSGRQHRQRHPPPPPPSPPRQDFRWDWEENRSYEGGDRRQREQKRSPRSREEMDWEDYRYYQRGYHDKKRIQGVFNAQLAAYVGMPAILILLTLILGPDMGLEGRRGEGDMWRNPEKYILKEKKPPQALDRSKEKPEE